MISISKDEVLEKIQDDPNSFADQFLELFRLVEKRIGESEQLVQRIEQMNSEMNDKNVLILEMGDILKHYKALTLH